MKKKNEIKPLNFHPLSADHVKELSAERTSLSEKLADILADFTGSWKFINLAILFFFFWFTVNTFSPIKFDPTPFLILNLSIGVISILQTPVIMLGQKSIDRKNQIKQEIQFNKIEMLEQKQEQIIRKIDKSLQKLEKLEGKSNEKED